MLWILWPRGREGAPSTAGAPPRRSNLGHAAIDEKLDAVDEARVFGRQEHGDLADLARIADPAERDLRGQIGLEGLPLGFAGSQSLQARRTHRARADRIYPDATFLQIEDPVPREITDRRLAGTVDAERWQRARRRGRAGQDDRSPVRHQRQRLLHG